MDKLIQTVGNFIPGTPQISMLFSLFQVLRRVDKTNQTPQHECHHAHVVKNNDIWGFGGVFL